MGKFDNLRGLLGLKDASFPTPGPTQQQKKKRTFSPQEIFQLKNSIHAASRSLTAEDWSSLFVASDTRQQGFLSFQDFRKTVRRAGIPPPVLSDEDLRDIVAIVDLDQSGQIDLEEFLAFLHPTFVPDVVARTSSTMGPARLAEHLTDNAGISVTEDGCYVQTGQVDGHAWTSLRGVEGRDTWVELELPRVYFVMQIHLWNFMSLQVQCL